MADRRYIVGERVLASRAEDGQNHEEATVVDYYVLLTEGDSIPSIVVDFDDGERKYMTAREPDILPLPEEEDDDAWRRRGRRGRDRRRTRARTTTALTTTSTMTTTRMRR